MLNLLLALFAVASPLSVYAGNGVNDGEGIYAFGDSIVAATQSGLPSDGSASFIVQYRDQYAPTLSVDHNLDGSGKGCIWARAHEATNLSGGNHSQLLVLAFGNNDPAASEGGLTPSQSATCLRKLYQDASTAGWTNIVWANIMPVNPACPHQPYDISLTKQRARVAAIDAAAASIGVAVWERWDAIDLVPHDGILEAPNPQLLLPLDCLHPNQAGHDVLADDLDGFL